MDPVTLIVTALTAGAAAGVGDAATTAVKDAYQGLKERLFARFSGKNTAEIVLAAHESDPQTWAAPLAKELLASGADTDSDVLEVAQRLLALVDREGSGAGKYTVDLRGAR
ncbi:hypothetical protein ABT352_39095 [Streptosporangium sp. NPDC000563]|uniref:hypothetical protein n=1 Tax=Streptosporangium sp. NPDC000563 TaxID=3154366 RepID=UPI0033210A73